MSSAHVQTRFRVMEVRIDVYGTDTNIIKLSIQFKDCYKT